MKGIRISSRYAKSLMNLCIERGILDSVFKDMESIRASINGSRELQVILNSPVVKPDKKASILKAIFSGTVSEPSMAFMVLLAHKGREGLLEEIAESFLDQVRRHQNITPARLVSATALDGSVRAKIEKLAEKLANGKVYIEESLNSELIGGFIIQVGDQRIDTSIQAEIRELKRAFDKNPYIAEL